MRRETDTITNLACMVAVDFVYIPLVGISWGDALDVGWQLGGNLANDTEIDPTIFALAMAGIVIDLAFDDNHDIQKFQPALSAVKAGFRAAKNVKMAPKVEKKLRRLSAGLIDTNGIDKFSLMSPKQTAKHLFRPEGFKAFKPMLDDLFSMYRHSGHATTPILALKYADDVSDFRLFSRMSQRFGKNTDGVIEALGKGFKRAFWRAGKVGTKATVQLAAWYSTLAASIVAFCIALSSSATGWLFKRLTLRWAKHRS